LLVSSPFPIHVWETLWRKYVHPSGYHLAGEVVIVSDVPVNVTTEESMPILDPRLKVVDAAYYTFGPIVGEVTGLYADNNNQAGSYVFPGYVEPNYALGEADADNALERLNVYSTPARFGLDKTIRYTDTNYANVDRWAGFRLSMDDTLTKFSSSTSLTTFDQEFHIQTTDSDGTVTLYNYYK